MNVKYTLGTFKMTTKHFIFGLLFLITLSCTNSTKNNEKKVTKTGSLSNQEQIESSKFKKEEHQFHIETFVYKADSLLKKIKGSQYSFELKTDTIDLTYQDKESRKFKVGMFYHLQSDSLTNVIRHYIFEPKTKAPLRIHLIEATFSSKESLENKISELFVSMNDSMVAGLDAVDFIKIGLTPCYDYIATGNNKLYWLNLYYPYNRADFHQFIACFKSVIDTTEFNERIICYQGGDCRNINVP